MSHIGPDAENGTLPSMSEDLMHEIRTPLTVVLGFLDVLDRHWHDLDETKRRECVAEALAHARALAVAMPDISAALSGSVVDLKDRDNART